MQWWEMVSKKELSLPRNSLFKNFFWLKKNITVTIHILSRGTDFLMLAKIQSNIRFFHVGCSDQHFRIFENLKNNMKQEREYIRNQ